MSFSDRTWQGHVEGGPKTYTYAARRGLGEVAFGLKGLMLCQETTAPNFVKIDGSMDDRGQKDILLKALKESNQFTPGDDYDHLQYIGKDENPRGAIQKILEGNESLRMSLEGIVNERMAQEKAASDAEEASKRARDEAAVIQQRADAAKAQEIADSLQ